MLTIEPWPSSRICGHDRLRSEKYVPEIDCDRVVEFGRTHRREIVALVAGGIVDQHRGGTECRAHGIESGAQGVDVGKIAGYEKRFSRAGAERVDERRAGLLLNIKKGDTRAVLSKGAHKGCADAARTAGDDDCAVLQRSVAGKIHSPPQASAYQSYKAVM